MTLKVHHLTVSQSERVVWLCEELGIDYELIVHERAPIFAPQELKALHPTGAAPVIQDGDVTIAESAACVEYICQKHGGGRFIVKPTEKNYADYLYWFHFANSTFQSTLMHNFMFRSAGVADDNPTVQRLLGKQNDLLAFIDKRLSQNQYLAGDELTAADIMNVVSLSSMRCFASYSLEGYHNILAYLERIAAREGYQRAIAKGDKDLDIKQITGAAPPPLQKGIAERFRAARQSKA